MNYNLAYLNTSRKNLSNSLFERSFLLFIPYGKRGFVREFL